MSGRMSRGLMRTAGMAMLTGMTIWGGGRALAQLHPWPMFGFDERNTCRSPHRGPHVLPELRWWDRLETPGTPHPGGAAIGWFNTQNEYDDFTRFIVVGAPCTDHSPMGACPLHSRELRFYRFHPSEPGYTPDVPVAPERVIITSSGGIRTTPLILPNSRVVILTENALECWAPPFPTAPGAPLWSISVPTTSGSNNSASPKAAVVGGQLRIYAWIGGVLYCVSDSGTIIWTGACTTSGHNDDGQTPAIGPLAGDPTRSLVYCASFSGQPAAERFHVFHADGNPQTGGGFLPLAWESRIERFFYLGGERKKEGTFGSAVVHRSGNAELDGAVVVGSDDGALYAFNNSASGGAAADRWQLDRMHYISSTPAVSPEGWVFYWAESGGNVERVTDSVASGTKSGHCQSHGWVWGAAALDSGGRYFFGNAAPPLGNTDDLRIFAFQQDIFDPPPTFQLKRAWPDDLDFEPPRIGIVPGVDDLRQSTRAPLAIDADGSLIIVNNGYIYSLRVPARFVGDFNLDGCTNNFDIDPFVLALLDPAGWDAAFGSFDKVNLLAIGDCNYDGYFNNFDIDCMVELLLAGCGDSPLAAGSGESAMSAQDRTHFDEVVAWLREQVEETSR